MAEFNPTIVGEDNQNVDITDPGDLIAINDGRIGTVAMGEEVNNG